MRQKIYCLSGLGADQRVFKNLSLKNVMLVHLPWQPFDDAETMETYAAKMSALIDDPHPTILGLSFGGMLATEIAKQREVKQTILISSVKGIQEFPDLSSTLVFLLKAGLLPFQLFKLPNKYLFERFGAYTEEEKQLLTALLKDTDTDYLKHAFKMIINWKNTILPENLIHIHGTHDRILPAAFVHPNHWVQDGTHMMIWNKSAIISQWIESKLF